MARTYKRDSRGRFASGGGGSSGGRPKARMATRGTNRLTRDNAGKITGTGDGATARGGRLKTAAGNQRGKVMARIGGGGGKLGGGKGKAAWTPKTNAKGQVTGMRNRNAPTPSREAVAKSARQSRAVRNLNAAMKREGDGPNSKASRSASVAKRASAIYSGKVDPKAKTKTRLTRTQDPEALRRRVKKMKDNTTAKPVRAKVKSRKISDAKAGRIVARVDARRPGMRKATASTRRDQNLLRTQQRATDFLLAPSRRALKRGSQIGTNESVRRAVANAKPRRRS